jgi:hypothetical protein
MTRFAPTLAMLIVGLTTPVLAQTVPPDRTPVQQQSAPSIEAEVGSFQVTVSDTLTQIKTQFAQRDNQIAADQQKIAALIQDGQAKDKTITDLKEQIAKLTPAKAATTVPEKVEGKP